MTTWTKLDITWKLFSQIQFCKRFWSLRTSTIKRDIPIKCLRKGIFVKSNTKSFTKFTNWNLSQRFNGVEEYEFPCNWTKSYLKRRDRFFSTVTWVLQPHTVWNQKKIGLLSLLNFEATSLTVFTTMCPKEQQTSDNLIVKDYCFIIEILDKFIFSGILKGCLKSFKWSLERISISQTTGIVK